MLTGNLFKYWTYQLFAPGKVLKDKYAAFKSLLDHDKHAHDLMAELEDIYYQHQKRDFSAVRRLCTDLTNQVLVEVSKPTPAPVKKEHVFEIERDPFTDLITQVNVKEI